MKIRPFFSLIVPIYNVETYLEQCIDSILNQSFKSFEIILIDDGSTDSSGIKCDEYERKDKRIKVIHKKNGGLSDARNFGLQVATGEYIWFIDSDDWIETNALSILNKHLENNYLEVISFSYYDYFEETKLKSDIRNPQIITKTNGDDFIKKSIYFFPSAWGYVYSKEFINRYNLKFKFDQIHEDDYFNLSCFGKIKRISRIKDSLYFYRRRKESLTTTLNVLIIKKRILSYINLIKLTNEIKGINRDYLEKKQIFYKKQLFQVLENLVALKLNFHEKYRLAKLVKNTLHKVSINKNDFSESKVRTINILMFNKSVFFYLLSKRFFQLYYKIFL